MKEHVISESTGISQPFYGGCPYAVSSEMYPGSLTLESGNSDNTEQIINYNDYSYAIDEGGTAGSSDTSIATVGAQSSSWWPVTGQGPGVVTVWAQTGNYYPTDAYGQYYNQFGAQLQAQVSCTIGLANVTGSRVSASQGNVIFKVANGTCPPGATVTVGVSVTGTTGSLSVTGWDPTNSTDVTLPNRGQLSALNTLVFNVSGTGSVTLQVSINPVQGYNISPNNVSTGAINFP